MNWGRGIFIVLLLFVIACVGFFVYTTTVDWTLVEEDYYPKELKHEEVLVKKRNYNALPAPLSVKLTTTSVDIRFPDCFKGQKVNGHIHVYRPSDQRLDYIVPVSLDSTLIQTLSRSHFSHGNYLIKIDWNSSGLEYYKEQELFVP
jgi:hypothetical protein